MLKHTSNAGGGVGGAGVGAGAAGGGAPAANGQLRNIPAVATAAATLPLPAASASASTARSIHLRPQQPLNISTLNASTTSSTLLNATSNSPPTANGTIGGQRLPAANHLLNIAQATTPGGGTATSTATTTTPVSPVTPNGGVGGGGLICNNLHTYTNQHVLAAHAHANATQVQHQQQQQQMPHHHNNNNNNHNINHNYSNFNNLTGVLINQSKHGPGPREALTSLGLLCLVSLLLALLSLIFLLKISPTGREDALTRSPTEDFVIVYDVTLALCALSLSLNLCCLLVCAIQFLFAVKLVRSPMFDGRDNKYLEKSSASRTCAVGGFFISIPIFLTGIILYTFNHFHSTPAIITSVLIGIGIVFCGGAMVHNVFIWQKEKTISYRSPPLNMSLVSAATHLGGGGSGGGPLTPPVQFLNSSLANHLQLPNHFNHSTSSNALQQQLLLHHHHPTSVTPVSPNHSQGSFNPLMSGAALSSSFLMRPSTATPPTPKPIQAHSGALALNGGGGVGREASGSVSPGIPAANLDMSNITSPSLHELSTLV